jgi:hypothetical protein
LILARDGNPIEPAGARRRDRQVEGLSKATDFLQPQRAAQFVFSPLEAVEMTA